MEDKEIKKLIEADIRDLRIRLRLDEEIDDLDDIDDFELESKAPKPIPWEDIEKKVFPNDRWRINKLIPKDGFTVLASIAGEKKSWTALEMARCIASGEDFLGHPEFKTMPGPVLYCDFEMAESEMQRRGKQLRLHTQKHGLYFFNQLEMNFNDPLAVKWMSLIIDYYKITTLIVDTFRAVSGGIEEEKAEKIRKFFNRFRDLKNRGISIIWLDHFRKPSNFEGKIPKKEHLLGSQDKTASVEVLLMLSSPDGGEEINVYQRKNRIGQEIKPFKILMRDELSEDDEIVTRLTYAGEIEEKETQKEKAKELILNMLEGVEGLTKKQLVQGIKSTAKIGDRNIQEALIELCDGRKLDVAKNGRENYYFIL